MNILRDNRGVVLVFVAMGLLVFLLFLGLALDTGWLVYVRAQGQTRVDAAALAAAVALTEKSPAARKDQAETLANTFGDKNPVVSDVSSDVSPMKYNLTSGNFELVDLGDDWRPGEDGLNCNAVRVTADVTTPVFFAGIRNVFGAGETGQENVTVRAIGHLPCTGMITTTGEGDGELKPPPNALAIVRGLVDFPGGCGRSHGLLELVNGALAQVTSLPQPVQVGTSIPLLSIQDPTELLDLLTNDPNALKVCPDTTIVPVVDDVGSGSKLIEGFAAICRTGSIDVGLTVTVPCGEVAKSSTGTGECFGTYASNPVLIR